jgi:hypothetical protein
MDYLQNHCWCSESNWGGKYDCRHIVSFRSYEHDAEDWNAVIDEEADTVFDEEGFERISKFFVEKKIDITEEVKQSYIKTVPNLKPHVLEWLENNVKDHDYDESGKGWCVGSVKYRATDSCHSFSVFFQRRKDAMAFIRAFSKYKKPVRYCQYFTDVRKTLDLETLKYTYDQ